MVLPRGRPPRPVPGRTAREALGGRTVVLLGRRTPRLPVAGP